jgi:hypothetical protein
MDDTMARRTIAAAKAERPFPIQRMLTGPNQTPQDHGLQVDLRRWSHNEKRAKPGGSARHPVRESGASRPDRSGVFEFVFVSRQHRTRS